MIKKMFTPVYVFVFGLFPVISLYLHNYFQVEFFRVVRAILAALLFTLLLLLILRSIFRSWSQSRATTMFFLIVLMNYGAFAEFLSMHPVFGISLGQAKYLVPIVLIFLGGSVGLLVRKKGWVVRLDQYGRWFAGGLILLLLVNTGCLLIRENRLRSDEAAGFPSSSRVDSEGLPNIYHIILDGYTGSDALLQDFGFDNSGFEDQLRELGFDIPAYSFSNYDETVASLGSELNMEFIQFLMPPDKDDPDKLMLIDRLVNSKVRAILEAEGYQTIAFENEFRWSLWGNADVYLSPRNRNFLFSPMNSFELLCVENSIGFLLTQYDSLFFRNYHENLALVNLDKYKEQSYILEELPKLEGYRSPKFVFAHTTITHVPFVFALDGSILPIEYQGSFTGTDFDDAKVRQGYLLSIQFANQQILQVVKDILSENPNAIILLQGDHGYPGANRHQIFLAVYDPKGSIRSLQCVTPVNLYRLILNSWLGTDYPLLSNTLFKTISTTYYNYQPLGTCESMTGQ